MSRLFDLLRPDEYCARLADIDIAVLKSRGFEAVILDLDNTLLPWKGSDVPESSRQWVAEAMRLGMKVCIVSNTHYPRRLRKIAEDLGVGWIDHALKPRAAGFERAAKTMQCLPEKIVVVGDQILTDILGGNVAAMHTILVKPMDRKEFIGTKINRLIERGIMALLGTNSDSIQSEKSDTK